MLAAASPVERWTSAAPGAGIPSKVSNRNRVRWDEPSAIRVAAAKSA